jgi:predicted RNase H-like HicB family nuclease
MRAYPETPTPEPDGGLTVAFPNVPEAITERDSREEALLRADDALGSAKNAAMSRPRTPRSGAYRGYFERHYHRRQDFVARQLCKSTQPC